MHILENTNQDLTVCNGTNEAWQQVIEKTGSACKFLESVEVLTCRTKASCFTDQFFVNDFKTCLLAVIYLL